MKITFLLLLLLGLPLVSATNVNLTQTYGPTQAQWGIYFSAAISQIDDKNSMLYTNSVILSLASFSEPNESFSGAFLFPYARDPSQLDCYPIWNRTKVGGQYLWDDSEFRFYKERFEWALLHYGLFPYDTFIWPMLIGANAPLTVTNPLQPLGDFPENITNEWNVEVPELLPLQSVPTNASLAKIWPGLSIPTQACGTLNGMNHWYYFQTAFSRKDASRWWLTFEFWIPSVGLLTVSSGWLVYASQRKKSNRILSVSVFGTLLTMTITLSFWLSSYASPNRTYEVQGVLYADIVLLFACLIVGLVLRPPSTDKAPGAAPVPDIPDIVLDTKDLKLNKVPWGTHAANHRIEFFNRGNVRGSLLSLSVQSQQIPQMRIYFNNMSSVRPPVLIDPKTHASFNYSAHFDRYPKQQPPQKIDVEVTVSFEVSTHVGREQRTGSFRIQAP